jgi:hypothetical protein
MTLGINPGVLNGNKNPDKNPMAQLSYCGKPIIAHYSREFKRIIYFTIILLYFIPLFKIVHIDLVKLHKPMTGSTLGIIGFCIASFSALMFISYRQLSKPALTISSDAIILKQNPFFPPLVLGWNQILGLQEDKMNTSRRLSPNSHGMEILRIIYRCFDKGSGEIVISEFLLKKNALRDGDTLFRLLKKTIPKEMATEQHNTSQTVSDRPFTPFFHNNIEFDSSGITIHTDTPENSSFIPWGRVTRFTVDRYALIKEDRAVLIFSYSTDSGIKDLMVEGRISKEMKSLAKNAAIRINPGALDKDVMIFMRSLSPRFVYTVLLGFILFLLILAGFLKNH